VLKVDAMEANIERGNVGSPSTGIISGNTMNYWKGNVPMSVATPQQTKEEELEAGSSFETARSSISGNDHPEKQTASAASKPPMARHDTDTRDWSVPSVKPAPIRSDTAPMQRKRPGMGEATRTDRPKATQRGTFRQAIMRKASASQFNQKPQDPCAVNFDTISDASDSSSSSSDEDAPIRSRTRRESGRNGGDGIGAGSANGKSKAAQSESASSRFKIANEQMSTKGRVSKRDGRLNISINEAANSGVLAKALGQRIKHHLDIPHRHGQKPGHDHSEAEKLAEAEDHSFRANEIHTSLRHTVARPKLNIVIMVIGSRGDIQPFLKVGKVLKNKYGHRVRIATHSAFRDFVQDDAGLEFFNIGGNPSELMAFMVKNPGLIPSFDTIKEGEIGRRRDQMAEMFEGFWRACINTTDDEHDEVSTSLTNTWNTTDEN
jgi:hypothetical protein